MAVYLVCGADVATVLCAEATWLLSVCRGNVAVVLCAEAT